MDIVHSCLSLVPVPDLSTAFTTFKFIWAMVEKVPASKQQLRALAQSIAQLLQTIHEEYQAGRLVRAKTSVVLDNFEMCVINI